MILSSGGPSLAGGPVPNPAASEPVWSIRVVHAYPHDPQAFTQGLIYYNGFLYESTGLYGRSSLRKVELETGRVLQSRELPREVFGEGLTLYRDRLIQLTWKSGVAFVWDCDNLQIVSSFHYSGEGWGIAGDGKHLFMSDGTALLRVLDPETFEEKGRIQVRDGHGPVSRMNELECVGGEIYANIWGEDYLIRIDPRSGKVLGRIDLSVLRKGLGPSRDAEVVNGIAYDAEHERLFVTGKCWPRLFEIAVNIK